MLRGRKVTIGLASHRSRVTDPPLYLYGQYMGSRLNQEALTQGRTDHFSTAFLWCQC